MPKNSLNQANNSAENVTYILDGIIMEGNLDGGDNPVVVEGRFKGEITATEFSIREQGQVAGKLFAKSVTIDGKFKGELECESLTVTQTGVVEGDVRANTLSIDLGAEVIGSISRIS